MTQAPTTSPVLTPAAAGTAPSPHRAPETAMPLPTPRGTLSRAVVRLLATERPDPTGEPTAAVRGLQAPAEHDDDAGIALWTLQELHYRGFAGVDEAWEWDPAVLGLRVRLEHDLERRLRERWAEAGVERPEADVAEALFALVADDDGPSLARHLQQHGTREEALELLRQRSIYHLKEADPTAWVVPRLASRVKAALVEIQFDEYGAGEPTRLHHHLFQRGLQASGLSPAYGAYIDEALPEVVEQNTVLSMLGLHRRLRGAALGHFAAVEATSSLPSRQLAQGLARVGLPAEMVGYYDEHVEADAVHEQLAARAVCGALVEDEPHLRDDVLMGAWTCLDLEARTASALLQRWSTASAA